MEFFRLAVSNHILSTKGLRAIKIFSEKDLHDKPHMMFVYDKPHMMFIYDNTSIKIEFDSDDTLFDYSAAIEKLTGTLQVESSSYWEENKHIIKNQ